MLTAVALADPAAKNRRLVEAPYRNSALTSSPPETRSCPESADQSTGDYVLSQIGMRESQVDQAFPARIDRRSALPIVVRQGSAPGSQDRTASGSAPRATR